MGSWPKKLRNLSEEEERIRDEFMKIWHEELPKKYGIIETFNHHFPLLGRKKGETILEIGAGLGEHLLYEEDDWQEYICVELRPNMAEEIKAKNSKVQIVVGDCQEQLPFPDSHFDRILAIHVLEHLPNLPAALQEIHRVLKEDGVFNICIPCEGGGAYSLARTISAKRIFDTHFPGKIYYDIIVANEHINLPREIIQELDKSFVVIKKRYFPWFIVK